ncbi:hypothetical protein D3C84_305570 [compost metagenome]
MLVDLVEQAADAAQGEVAEGVGEGEQLDEGSFAQQQAEGVLAGQVLGTGGALAEQGSQGKALATGDLEGGLGAAPGRVRPFADHAALLDDVEVLHRPVLGLDDGVAGCIETQPAVLDEKGQVSAFHLVEGRVLLQELHGAVDVLHHRLLAGLGKGVCLVHGPACLVFVSGVMLLVTGRDTNWT